jgi:hypothetical protein
MAGPAVVALLVALVFAACGGDDAPSREDFVEDAERICRDTEKELRDAAGDASSRREVAEAIDTVIERTRSSVDRLQELEVPDGDAGRTAEDFVDALQSDVEDEGVPVLEDLRDALREGDQEAARQAVRRLQGLERNSRSDRLARELGADACAA